MPHRNHAAMRVHRFVSHKYLEVLIWAVIGLVLYVMIRFVLVDLVEFARLSSPPSEAAWAVQPVVEPAPWP